MDEFMPIAPPPSKGGGTAQAEAEQLESFPGAPPNSVTIQFGKAICIRWHAETSIPVFCFVTIIMLIVFGVVLALIGWAAPTASWIPDVFKIIGQAMLTLVGAVVGASATSAIRRRR